MVKKKIYPTSHKKYLHCSIKKVNDHSFKACVVGPKNQLRKRIYKEKSNFKTYEQALKFIKKKSKEHNFPIRNMIYDRGDYCECVLTQGKKMKFDKEDIDKVQTHFIHAEKKNRTWYACTTIKRNTTQFSNIIMNHKSTRRSLTIDHIDQDGLNNRKDNLRLANKSEQSVNRRKATNNTSGIKGVSFDKSKNQWVAQWSEPKINHRKRFSCNKYGDKAKQMAIDYRNKMVTESVHYNFLKK